MPDLSYNDGRCPANIIQKNYCFILFQNSQKMPNLSNRRILPATYFEDRENFLDKLKQMESTLELRKLKQEE